MKNSAKCCNARTDPNGAYRKSLLTVVLVLAGILSGWYISWTRSGHLGSEKNQGASAITAEGSDDSDNAPFSKRLTAEEANVFFMKHAGIQLPTSTQAQAGGLLRIPPKELSAFLKLLDAKVDFNASKWSEAICSGAATKEIRGASGHLWKKGSIRYYFAPTMLGAPTPQYTFYFDPVDGKALLIWRSHWNG